MKRALDLAQNGQGSVSPNPLVGSVIVHDHQIIGEGWHQKFGKAHAEVNAIHSVKNTELLSESTLYVNLEPCAHYGKTPPCANLIVDHKIKRVVIANIDPNPKVAGKGIKILKDAGIEVIEGIMEKDAFHLNRRFFTSILEKRPYIILKWAETKDGFIARKNYDSKWISDEYSRKLVHKWRAEEDAIMVGTNTALYDNPKLNVRDWEGNDPVRVVLDTRLRLEKDLNLMDGSIPTLCYNLITDHVEKNLSLIQLTEKGLLQEILHDLNNREIQSLMVEGGATLLNSFLEAGFWDEARVFSSMQEFGNGISSPKIEQEPAYIEKLTGDTLYTYYKSK